MQVLGSEVDFQCRLPEKTEFPSVLAPGNDVRAESGYQEKESRVLGDDAFLVPCSV